MSEPSPHVVALADLPTLAGEDLGTTEPVVVTQEQVDAFAAVTRDEQWLHVDRQRAAAGPFGGTIAHGYLTLSLTTHLLFQLLEVTGAASVVNYGLNKVRFPAPLRVGEAVQFSAAVTSVDEVRGGYHVVYTGTFRVPGGAKPVCTLEGVFRYYRG